MNKLMLLLWIIIALRVACRKWESRQCKVHDGYTIVCRSVTDIPSDLPSNIKVLDLRLSFIKSAVNLTMLSVYRNLSVVDLRKQLTRFDCNDTARYRFKVLTDCVRNRRFTTAGDMELTTAVNEDDLAEVETTTSEETTTTDVNDVDTLKTTPLKTFTSENTVRTTPKQRRRFPDANKHTAPPYHTTPRVQPNPRFVTTTPLGLTASTTHKTDGNSTTTVAPENTMKWLWICLSVAGALTIMMAVWFLWWCITTFCLRAKCRRSCGTYCRLRKRDSDDPDDDDTVFQQTPPATEPMPRESTPAETLSMREYPVMGRWRPIKKQD